MNKERAKLVEKLLKEREEEIAIARKSKGLGDTIAKVTSAVGIKPCGGCKKRQEKLNKIFPYENQD